MRVLHLADRLTERGGAYQHLLAVIEAQVAAGRAVHLAVGTVDPGMRAPCPLTVVPGLEARTAADAPLDGLVSAVRPDVVHVHTVVNPSVLRWASARPALVTVQDHRYFCPGRGKWTLAGDVCRVPASPEACAACFEDARYFEEIAATTRERLDALRQLPVVVLSRYMQAELGAVGVAADRVRVIPPFVRDLPAPADAGAPCVLFVGRLVAGKGPLEALQAWRRSGVALPFVVAGAGPLRPQLEQEGASVVGWADRTGLAALLRRARVVVMPSRWQEPFGIVGLEALGRGVPVAAWDSGGVREWHPGDGLVPWGDVDGLGRAIARLVGRTAQPPAGFERATLMARLDEAYAAAVGA